MAIVSTKRGGAVKGIGADALSWDQVDAICERFESLKPYSSKTVPGLLLELEKENFESSSRRQLWCYALSAKRYLLYNEDARGEVT